MKSFQNKLYKTFCSHKTRIESVKLQVKRFFPISRTIQENLFVTLVSKNSMQVHNWFSNFRNSSTVTKFAVHSKTHHEKQLENNNLIIP